MDNKAAVDNKTSDNKTSRLMLVLGSFLAGLVLFFAAILVISGRAPSPLGAVAASAGRSVFEDQNGKAGHRSGHEGPAIPGVLRFHPLPGYLPDHVVRDVAAHAEARAGRRQDRRIVHHGRSGARYARGDEDHLSNFDPHLRGLTGDTAAVTAAIKAYRVYAKKVPLEGGDYTMDHTAVVYLMDKSGHFVAPFSMSRAVDAEAVDLRRYL